jgi:hypothetical protein
MNIETMQDELRQAALQLETVANLMWLSSLDSADVDKVKEVLDCADSILRDAIAQAEVVAAELASSK